jgi:tetratricopeptide (TPR) repeat protein
LGDVLALQDNVARAIADEIRVKLTPQEQLRLASNRPVDPAAYESYLKGRYYLDKRTEDGARKGLEYFHQAIDLSPAYALAYAGVAESYYMLANGGFLTPAEAHPKAKAAALRALEMDTNLAEAHATLAAVIQEYEFDWSSAEKEFRRAIELNPNSANAHHLYAWHLAMTGRPEEAVKEVKRAQELDPLSLLINTNVGRMFYYARRSDEAIQQCLETLEMDSTFPLAHYVLGMAYAQRRMYDQSIAELQKAVSLDDRRSIAWATLGQAYALAGRKVHAVEVIERLNSLAKTHYVDPAGFVFVYAGLGDKDQAFAWLERAYQEHSVMISVMKTDSRFDPLRSDPRYADLLQRIGLPH